MIKAWICYSHYYEGDDKEDISSPVIFFDEPNKYLYDKIIEIVYAEVKKYGK